MKQSNPWHSPAYDGAGMSMNLHGRGLVRESGAVTQRILDSARTSPHSDLVKSLSLACAVPYLFYSGQIDVLLEVFNDMIELQKSQEQSGHTPIVFAGVMQSVSASAFWPTTLLIAGRVDEAFSAAQQVLRTLISCLSVFVCVYVGFWLGNDVKNNMYLIVSK